MHHHIDNHVFYYFTPIDIDADASTAIAKNHKSHIPTLMSMNVRYPNHKRLSFRTHRIQTHHTSI